MRKVLLAVALLGLASLAEGQTYKEVLMHMSEMLQFEHAKQKAADKQQLSKFKSQPFKKLGFSQIRVSDILEKNDPRHLWGYGVSRNQDFDYITQPLYKLFRPKSWDSMAVIDYYYGNNYRCDLIFWGKKYYRRFSSELRRMGFYLRNSEWQTNVLEFRNPEVSIGVDVIVWPEVYVMQIFSLAQVGNSYGLGR